MPLSENAEYQEWAIHFSRYLPLIKKNFILIGESLGGVFLAKYLSENKLKKKALSVYLVCPPFDDSLPGEDLVNGFTLKSDLSLLEKNTQNLYLLFSVKDDVVPVEHAEKYRAKLKKAKIIIYKNIKGHFQVAKFPEIVKLIKSDLKNNKII
jgi:predicted alpha/beta hydrolase family esterase